MFHIILFEPEIPPNTGNIIRLCANTGAKLHLVKPLGFRLDARSLRRSGLDYHDLAEVSVYVDFAALREALAGSRIFAVETGSPHDYAAERYAQGDAFLFGPESSGLPAPILASLGGDRHLSIPMQACNRSLNLSNSVAVVLYEAWRQCGFAAPLR